LPGSQASTSTNPAPAVTFQPTDPTTPAAETDPTSSPQETDLTTTVGGSTTIIVEIDDPGQPFDRRLLGTNVPAWVNPSNMSDETFRTRITDLGPTLLRLPGGSWSNYYDWLGCETGDEQVGSAGECYWPWAAKPSDFLDLLVDTDQEAMWTVSINGTPQEAAALVAFFNGNVDDDRPIGIDRNGRDWQTVGTWARLRRDVGYPEPYPILLWEVGNEIYGAKAETAGPDCLDWGWEGVWTCDPDEYVFGNGEYEGYLAFREAMRAVDPDILVGAVGVDYPAEWWNWGERVIAGTGDQLDFYVVHNYAFWEMPATVDEILVRPQQIWPQVMTEINAAFDQHAGGRRAPVAVTEYNLFSFQDVDNNQWMRKAVNALFIADSLGQMAVSGVAIANQWNLANGQPANGTDYGLINVETKAPNPQYYAFQVWQRFGTMLLPLTNPFDSETTLSVYAGRSEAGTITVIAINKTDQPIEASLQLGDAQTSWQGSFNVLSAESLESETMQLNGQNLGESAPATTVPEFTQTTDQTFTPYSITLLQFEPQS
jgi:alpha-L-arabinofuranosidase